MVFNFNTEVSKFDLSMDFIDLAVYLVLPALFKLTNSKV